MSDRPTHAGRHRFADAGLPEFDRELRDDRRAERALLWKGLIALLLTLLLVLARQYWWV